LDEQRREFALVIAQRERRIISQTAAATATISCGTVGTTSMIGMLSAAIWQPQAVVAGGASGVVVGAMLVAMMLRGRS
jgi:hypothetical protein